MLLIVDDDRDLVSTLADGCALLGVECRRAHSLAELIERGGEALRCARALIDLELPDGSGLEAARLLRARGFDGPIRFMSSHDTSHPLVTAAEEHSGAPILRKPILIGDLTAILG